MKICVCSDSHGNWKALQEMLDREKPRAIFFLGDGERDWSRVDVPSDVLFQAVCGNCDFMAMEPPMRTLEIYGKKIFLTHGHFYGVKQGLYGLEQYTAETPVSLICYGHTHHPQLDNDGKCLYLCPGSMGYRDEQYAVVTLNETQHIDVSFRRL